MYLVVKTVDLSGTVLQIMPDFIRGIRDKLAFNFNYKLWQNDMLK